MAASKIPTIARGVPTEVFADETFTASPSSDSDGVSLRTANGVRPRKWILRVSNAVSNTLTNTTAWGYVATSDRWEILAVPGSLTMFSSLAIPTGGTVSVVLDDMAYDRFYLQASGLTSVVSYDLTPIG